MFLPLGFEHSYERRPWATWGLLLVNALVFFLAELPEDDPTYGGHALDPGDFRLLQLVTSQFLHVDVVHLLGNLLFLWVFGRYVEDRLGPWRFLTLYLACGVAGDLTYLLSGVALPAVGASGAIAGLMGWVLVAAPWLEARVVLSVGYYPVNIAVGWFLVPWILWELLSNWLTGQPGVAMAAHVGGFVFGAAAAVVIRSPRCAGTGWYIDPLPPRGGPAAVRRLHAARGWARLRP